MAYFESTIHLPDGSNFIGIFYPSELYIGFLFNKYLPYHMQRYLYFLPKRPHMEIVEMSEDKRNIWVEQGKK